MGPRDTLVVRHQIERAERPRDESSLTVNVEREVLANHAGVGWRGPAIHCWKSEALSCVDQTPESRHASEKHPESLPRPWHQVII